MGRRPLSSYTEEEIEKMQTQKLINEVDSFFASWGSDDVEELEQFIIKTEGTPIFFYLMAKLVRRAQTLNEENEGLKSRVEKLEEAIEGLGNFRKRNEYGY